MAKPLDSTAEEAPVEKRTAKGKSDPKEIVSMMGMAMLDNGGLQVIDEALKGSQDPGQVVGRFLAQMVGQLAEFTRDNMDIDPGVYLQPDGFLDQILDYIERKLGLPKEFSDQVYGETLEVIKAAAADPNAQGGGAAPAGPAPGPGAPAPAGPGLDAMGGM